MVQAGEMIGPYRIVEQVGIGGMATVYKAYHAKLDRYVAIKMLHQSLTTEPNFLARFEREAQIIARLEHPNIVSVYDFSEHDGNPYLVMRFVEGQALDRILRKSPLVLPETVRIMSAIGDALAYAHEHDVLHRDVKPSNIIIDERGTPYLTDFGLARMVHGGSSTMSQGTIIGTPHYISPEQALGQSELDARTDVYSVGVVLYELVVGRVPFAGDTPFSIVHDHIYTPLPMPREVNPNVSLPVESVLVKALAKDPDSRYQNITALMSDFRSAAQGEDAGQPAPARAKQPPSPAVTAVESAPDPFPGPASAREPGRAAPPRPPSPPIPWRERGQERRTEFKFDFRDLEDLGDKIGSKVEAWAESVEDWAEQFEEDNKSKSRSRRKKELTPEEQIRLRVEKRIKARQELIAHAAVYIMVNALLWVIWLLASGGEDFAWPLIVMFGWGIGMVAHLIDYNQQYGRGAQNKEREIQRELARARERGELPPLSQVEEPGKRKNEDLAGRRVRLTDDGELTDSFIEAMDEVEKPKRGRRR